MSQKDPIPKLQGIPQIRLCFHQPLLPHEQKWSISYLGCMSSSLSLPSSAFAHPFLQLVSDVAAIGLLNALNMSPRTKSEL